jgi:pheromone shutdown protein TraB
MLALSTANKFLGKSDDRLLQVQGSPTSGRDVTALIEGQKPAAVVLELCASRFKSLNREITQVTFD